MRGRGRLQERKLVADGIRGIPRCHAAGEIEQLLVGALAGKAEQVCPLLVGQAVGVGFVDGHVARSILKTILIREYEPRNGNQDKSNLKEERRRTESGMGRKASAYKAAHAISQSLLF